MSKNVSVVIPVYNGEAFIGRAINSVLSQSIRPYEIIVVNDGSKDGTATKLSEFGSLIKVIAIPNGGVSNARNTGIKASSGDLVAFLDADDVWYEDKLKAQLEVFERYPDVGFSCCNYISLNKQLNQQVSHFSIFAIDTDIIYDQPLKISPLQVLVRHNFVGTCSNVIIKRQVLDRVGLFNVNYKQAEDYDLWLRCALVTDFVLQSSVLLEKKSHDANLTNDFLETLLYHEKVLTGLESNKHATQQLHAIQSKYRSALAAVRYEIGNLFYEEGMVKKSFSYFFLGLRTSPSLKNFGLFAYFFGRKFIRTLSFGLIKNRKYN